MAAHMGQQDLAREMLACLPEGFRRIDLEARAAGAVSQTAVSAAREDGAEKSFPVPDSIDSAAVRLREAMFTPGAGTWFSMTMTVTADQQMDATYNYDELPVGDFEFAPEEFVRDLEDFPRDDENIPEWLREMVRSAGGEERR
jgi:hypothetical protein